MKANGKEGQTHQSFIGLLLLITNIKITHKVHKLGATHSIQVKRNFQKGQNAAITANRPTSQAARPKKTSRFLRMIPPYLEG